MGYRVRMGYRLVVSGQGTMDASRIGLMLVLRLTAIAIAVPIAVTIKE